MMRIHSPGDMRALRLLTGISAEQAGQLFGCTAQSVVDQERGSEVVAGIWSTGGASSSKSGFLIKVTRDPLVAGFMRDLCGLLR